MPRRPRQVAIEREFPNARAAADQLLRAIKAAPKHWNIDTHDLLPAYLASVCAALEHRVNNAFIRHFHSKFGDHYESYVAPFLRMGIDQKMANLFPMITDFGFELNGANERVKTFFKVFRLRNRLIHQSPHLIAVTWLDPDGPESRLEYQDPKLKHGHAHQEWWTMTRGGLVTIQATLNYWVSYLAHIEYRITRKNFNHEGILKQIRRSGS